MRRTWIGLLAACALTLASSGSASATPLSYTFDASNEGWTQNQDQSSNDFVSADFQPTDGNPGGHLSAVDTGSDSGCPASIPCRSLTFYSPSLSAHFGANYGGMASFDIRSSSSPGYAAEVLFYPDGPNYLDGSLPEDLGTDWHHLSIALNETAKWLVCSYAGGDCSTPSQAQFKDLLAASGHVAVMADVGPNESSMDTYELDNLSLTDPPQPQKKCKKKKHKRAGAAKKKKKCKKKGRAKVRG